MIKNSRLEKLVALRHRVTVYVPATQGVATACDNTAAVESTAALLSGLFGGATASPALGYWLSDEAGLVAEKTTVVFAFADESALASGLESVIDHCEKMRRDMDQEAVALEIDGVMYFV